MSQEEGTESIPKHCEKPSIEAIIPEKSTQVHSKGVLEKEKKPNTAQEKLPKLSIRFDGIQHFINFDDNSQRKGFRCKLTGCGKQTTVYCEKCNVHLCFVPAKSSRGRNCFKKFHVLKEN